MEEQVAYQILQRLPREGFLKISRDEDLRLSQDTKIQLNRRGNQLFNEGKLEQAKRIFLTTGYSDGLIRVGDAYLERKQPLEALRMYWLAPYPKRVGEMTAQMALVIRDWLKQKQREVG